MKFPRFSGRVALVLCAALVALTVGTQTVSAATLPTLGTRLFYTLGSFLRGGMIHTGTAVTNTTSLAGGWDVLPEFSNKTTLRSVTTSIASAFPYKGTFNAFVVGTGSTTIRYNAVCVPVPTSKIQGAGSGLILNLYYHSKFNPAGVGGDIGIVDDCGKTTSGSNLINDVCTSSGCYSAYTTGTLGAGSGKYIKFTPRNNLTSGYQGRITFEMLNLYSE